MAKHTTNRTGVSRITASLLLASPILLAAACTPEPTGAVTTPSTPPGALERTMLRERVIDTLVAQTQSPNAQVRANAIEALHAVPSRVEPVVRAALADPNLGVRFTAAMTVGKLGLKETLPLVRPLLNDPDRRVRAAAIYALRSIGEDVNPTPIADLLADPDPLVRAQAALILGRAGDPSAIPLLRSASRRYTSGPPAQVHLFELQVAEALVRLGDEEAYHAIRSALYPTAQEDFEAAILAAQILGDLGDRSAIGELKNVVLELAPGANADAPPQRRQYLFSKEMRLAAATALAELGDPTGGYVAEMYDRDPDPAIRAQAAFLYGQTGLPRVIPRLQAMLDDPSEIVRVHAAAALLRLLDPA